jgi:hypothetical protein
LLYALAGRGWKVALQADAGLAEGLSRWDGHLVGELVGMAHGIPTVPVGRWRRTEGTSPPHPF